MDGLPGDAPEGQREVGDQDPELPNLATLLCAQEAALGLRSVAAVGSLGSWFARVVALLRAIDRSDGGHWAELESLLDSVTPDLGTGAVSGGDGYALLDRAELADLTDICGLGDRAARHARDLVVRFHCKRSESGSFFRDVRMTPAHFDEVVALTASHLLRGRRGAEALPPAWRVLAVLFWLAQRGRQRVCARAVDVAKSTLVEVLDTCRASSLPWPARSRVARARSALPDMHRLLPDDRREFNGVAGSVRCTTPMNLPTECRRGRRLSARDRGLGPCGHTHTQSHVSHAYTTLSFTPIISLGTVATPLMAATPHCLPPLESTKRTTQLRMPHPLYFCRPLRTPVVYATVWASFRGRAATRLRSRGAHGSRQCCYPTGSCDHCLWRNSFSATQVLDSHRFLYIFFMNASVQRGVHLRWGRAGAL